MTVSTVAQLAGVIQGEANNPADQYGVASVMYNRLNTPGFGSTIPQAVTYNQFAAVNSPQAPSAYATSLATDLFNGQPPGTSSGTAGTTGNALYYNAPGYAYQPTGANSYGSGTNVYSDVFNQQPTSNFQLPQMGGSGAPNGTGSPIGGDGSNIASQSFSPPVTDFQGSGISTGASGNSIAYNNPYTLGGDASGSSFQGAPAPDMSASSTPYFGTPGSAPANPPQAMASVPGTTNSAGFASTLSGMWEALGVTAVTTAANTQANALTAATAAQNATAVADTGTLTGTIASAFNATFSNVSNLFVRGGVLLFGAIFLAAGLWFLARQQEA